MNPKEAILMEAIADIIYASGLFEEGTAPIYKFGCWTIEAVPKGPEVQPEEPDA